MIKSEFLNSENICLINENNTSVTYCEIYQFSLKLKFIKANELSILLVDNDLISYKLYLGLLIAKKPFLILDKNLPIDFINKFISDYQPTHIFSSSTFISSNLLNDFHYRVIARKNNFKINLNIALIIPTSGSTGDQKSVMLSYKSLEVNAKSISEYLKLNDKDISITNLPLSYAYGISIVNSHFLSGGRILVTNLSIIQKRFWELFDEFKITNFNGVPYTYITMVRMNLNIFKRKSFRFFTQAGGHLDQKVKKKYLEFCMQNKKDIFIMYGQTEASPRISYFPLNLFSDKINSIGKSIPNGRIFLKDGDTILNNDLQEGELCYEGDNIFIGYANSYKELSKVQVIKVLYTGDIAYRDVDGFYFITGRKSRFTKIDGKRISLDSIQNELINTLEKEVICVEKSDKILIVSEEEIIINDDFKELMKKFNIRKSNYEIIRIESFPRNSSGKIMYNNIN